MIVFDMFIDIESNNTIYYNVVFVTSYVLFNDVTPPGCLCPVVIEPKWRESVNVTIDLWH